MRYALPASMDLMKCSSLMLAGVLLSACVYYDSRWGQGTAEQKHAAARLHLRRT